MTALTPHQMRELAEGGEEYAFPTQYMPKETPNYVLVRDLTAALRTAADQLEAVQAYAESNYSASTVARQIVRMMKRSSDD